MAVAAVHPGGIPATRLPRHLGVPKAVQAVLLPLIRPVFKSIPQGAATQVRDGHTRVYVSACVLACCCAGWCSGVPCMRWVACAVGCQ